MNANEPAWKTSGRSSDIGLTDGSGYSLMAELRERYGLNGIALTGYGMDQDVSRAQAAGFLVHLTKPVRVASLEQALDDTFRCQAAGDANGSVL